MDILTIFSGSVRSADTSLSTFPIESMNGFTIIRGVDFFDRRNYWNFEYPAFMVTDTAFYRNQNYHDSGDLKDISLFYIFPEAVQS